MGCTEVASLTAQLMRLVLRDSVYLEVKSSVIAAACLTIAINICLSPICKEINGLSNVDVQNIERVRRGGTYFETDHWNTHDFDCGSSEK